MTEMEYDVLVRMRNEAEAELAMARLRLNLAFDAHKLLQRLVDLHVAGEVWPKIYKRKPKRRAVPSAAKNSPKTSR